MTFQGKRHALGDLDMTSGPLESEIEEILTRLDGVEPEAHPAEIWTRFDVRHWRALFSILAVAADFPRLDLNSRQRHPSRIWPALATQAARLMTAQRMVACPMVLPGSVEVFPYSSADSAAARQELETDYCVHVDDLLAVPGARLELDAIIKKRAEGEWGQLSTAEAPDLHRITAQIVGSASFEQLTGFQSQEDEYTLTLSLQSLEPAGIAWHQDLYWPREWVGEDVFAVLYALGNDSREKGGPFLMYSPHSNRLSHIFRRAHQATVLWNCRRTEDRPFHAVGGYAGLDTKRPLLILQCLRRQR